MLYACPSLLVLPHIADLVYTGQLKPYVSRAVTPTHPNHWPIAESKPQEHLGLSQSTERQSIYGPNGFDGAYYLQLARAKETGLRAAQPEKRCVYLTVLLDWRYITQLCLFRG